MREIKFRAWEFPHTMDDGSFVPGCMHYINSLYWFEEAGVRDAKDCDDIYIIMQHIGLKDKKGKEIYEGDVIKYSILDPMDFDYPTLEPIRYSIIKWSKSAVGFAPMATSPVRFETIEIVGNIYENPELIEKCI